MDLIDINLQNYIEFWKYYQSPKVQITHLLKMGIQINAITKQVKATFDKLQMSNKADNFDIAMYLSLIDNAPATSSKLLKKDTNTV